MKLIELVEKYKGTAKFDVNGIIDGESRDMIVFAIDERDAVKDEIINGEVLRYAVTNLVNTTPTISVVIVPKEKKEEPPAQENEGNEQKEPEETNGGLAGE